jgi:hypothetical protein
VSAEVPGRNLGIVLCVHVPPASRSLGHQMAQGRLKPHGTKVGYAASERQHFLKADLKPNYLASKRECRLGVGRDVERPLTATRPTVS